MYIRIEYFIHVKKAANNVKDLTLALLFVKVK